MPPPRAHLVKWGGVFAPNSPPRPKIILKPGVKKAGRHERVAVGGARDHADDQPDSKPGGLQGSSWARLLSRFFNIDITSCPCGGELRAVAAICDPDEARRYLRHVGLLSDPPARAPPHYAPVVMEFDAGPAVDASTDQMPLPGWE
ncbi:MAG: hypothetical protein RLZ25_1641 [Pseudomonadota bacterium]